MIYGDNQKAVKYAIVDNEEIYFDKDGKVIKTEEYNQNTISLPNIDSTQDDIQILDVRRIPDINSILQSNNSYAYCMNNPINYQDKTGKSATATLILTTAPKWAPVVIKLAISITAGTIAGESITYFREHTKRKGSKAKTNDTHTKPRPGRQSEKKKQKEEWKRRK